MGKVVVRVLVAVVTVLGLVVITFAVATAQSSLQRSPVLLTLEVTPSIKVSDQPIVNHTITIDEVVATQESWVAIHTLHANGKPILNQIVGIAPVKEGTTKAVQINLTESFKPGDNLLAMLHVDEGAHGTFEFPGGADIAVQLADQIVTDQFAILSDPAQPPTVMPATGADSGHLAMLVLLAAFMLLLGVELNRRVRMQ